MHFKKFFVFVFLMAPCIAFAGVVFNEIAWMGTLVSANDEWLELKNNTSGDIDLSGWKLVAKDGVPTITIASTTCANTKILAAGGYFLLERTNDESVFGIDADCIYAGSLENGGETLRLLDSKGNEIDLVENGNGWKAGDNATKNSMQRSVSVSGWITAIPTPKAENAVAMINPRPNNDTRMADDSPKAGMNDSSKDPLIPLVSKMSLSQDSNQENTTGKNTATSSLPGGIIDNPRSVAAGALSSSVSKEFIWLIISITIGTVLGCVVVYVRRKFYLF